ncbi:MAG: hypothetical protein NUW37_11470 [Planctomycetes bacterium]|nr:hypothetical protein [Planctomycetota bacterium]
MKHTLSIVSIFVMVVVIAQSGAAEDYPYRAALKSKVITPFVEIVEDANGNGRYDRGEKFDDRNGNGSFDPVFIGGYGANRRAIGVHDDLYARALAVSSAGETVIVMYMDWVGLLYNHCAAIKQRIRIARPEIPWNNIVVGSTHNHHGPDMIGIWGPVPYLVSGVDYEYLNWALDRAAETAIEAFDSMQPARLKAIEVDCDKFVKDIHDPKIKDPMLTALQFEGPGGVIGTFFNWAAHPELLIESQTQITADYPHYLRKITEERFGGLAMFTPGPLGGMQTPDAPGNTFADAEYIGRGLAAAAAESLEKQTAYEPAKLEIITERFDVPITNPRFVLAIRAGLIGDRTRTPEVDGRLQAPSEVHYIKLGGLEIVSNPGEMFPEDGFRVQEQMEGRLNFILGLCSNEIGYLVPHEIWDPTMYEATMSQGEQTSPLFLEYFSGLLNSDFAERRRNQANVEEMTVPILAELPARTSPEAPWIQAEQSWEELRKPAGAADDGEDDF